MFPAFSASPRLNEVRAFTRTTDCPLPTSGYRLALVMVNLATL
jgi:hypothetical protein